MAGKLDDEGNLHLPARVIAPPRRVSDAARERLTAAPFALAPWPEPSDHDAWKALIAQCDVHLKGVFAPVAERFPAEILAKPLNGGATLYEIVPPEIAETNEGRAIYFVHGGCYVFGGGEIAARMAQVMAVVAKCRVFSIDYRMPPDHAFPAGLNDVIDGYRVLTERYDPDSIAFGGVSAGAGLSAAALLKLRDMGEPLPAVAFLNTPMADLEETGDTFDTNAGVDNILIERMPKPCRLYAGDHDLADPYISPINGAFHDFPPTILLSGTRDLFLSNTAIMHRSLLRAGVEAELHVFEAMPHGGFGGAPEDREAMLQQLAFFDKHLSGK